MYRVKAESGRVGKGETLDVGMSAYVNPSMAGEERLQRLRHAACTGGLTALKGIIG